MCQTYFAKNISACASTLPTISILKLSYGMKYFLFSEQTKLDVR